MANPITMIPPTATAGPDVDQTPSTTENLTAILDALEAAGVLRFVRAVLEQREPIAAQVMHKLDTEPTKTGLKNVLTLAMGLGELPDGFGTTLMHALAVGASRAGEASQEPDADKMSIWALMGMLKDPDVARAMHYVMGFLQGLGKALAQPDK
jgi:uncharacterized protein YjgD (DUF1641 family)